MPLGGRVTTAERLRSKRGSSLFAVSDEVAERFRLRFLEGVA